MLDQADAALLSRTKALVHELADFLRARNALDTPGEYGSHAPGEWDAPKVSAIIQNLQEMNIAYAEEFAGRAMAILEAFSGRSILPKSAHPSFFQHPTNTLGVKEVMTELGYMAEKLELREG